MLTVLSLVSTLAYAVPTHEFELKKEGPAFAAADSAALDCWGSTRAIAASVSDGDVVVTLWGVDTETPDLRLLDTHTVAGLEGPEVSDIILLERSDRAVLSLYLPSVNHTLLVAMELRGTAIDIDSITGPLIGRVHLASIGDTAFVAVANEDAWFVASTWDYGGVGSYAYKVDEVVFPGSSSSVWWWTPSSRIAARPFQGRSAAEVMVAMSRSEDDDCSRELVAIDVDPENLSMTVLGQTEGPSPWGYCGSVADLVRLHDERVVLAYDMIWPYSYVSTWVVENGEPELVVEVDVNYTGTWGSVVDLAPWPAGDSMVADYRPLELAYSPYSQLLAWAADFYDEIAHDWKPSAGAAEVHGFCTVEDDNYLQLIPVSATQAELHLLHINHIDTF